MKNRPARISISSCKKDFPIFQTREGRRLIYLDNAATTQKPKQVIDAIARFYTENNANPNRGVYALAERATALYESARQRTAAWLHAMPEEIIFTKSATEALNLVMYSWGKSQAGHGDDIIVSVAEHHANFVPWQALAQEKEARLVVLPLGKDGCVDMAALTISLSGKTRIVALTHVSNVLGTTNPISAIACLVKACAPRAIFVVDGSQSAPHMKIDVKALRCDVFVCSSHKMLGPQGIGILYAKSGLLESTPPFLYGGDMIDTVTPVKTTWAPLPRKFEGGTQHPAAAVALHAALDYLDDLGMKKVESHCKSLGAYAISLLEKNPRVTVFSHMKDTNGIVSFAVEGVHAHDVAAILDEEGIAVRAGHHCAQPLMATLGVAATVRVSFSVYNTRTDAEALARSVQRALKVLHGI